MYFNAIGKSPVESLQTKIKMYIKSNLYKEVTFGTKKCPYKTGDLLKEVQFI